ncbi:MAG: DNA cytosine methyltransferase [Bacteroidetes bacterium]|jgi:DNA (cytosine-5)-methyltransferase 1|nr:DNA cytosine methyltransferase [Bacteroidota bacterium]MBT6686867.1 DNA cytosine methyltransferase [Bacteroidota bacterium]MBT7144635.1 DNA cytosine methyltransferase [Bacteroidota bacterium]MBT7490945.1 DNA cytosine methyltransferase [Bacteroidota bacterium]
MKLLYNHISPRLSDLEWDMAKHIPEGGNWQNIPVHIPSQRLEQIRKSGGRTTYYGRLKYDKPAFTITTYFNRLGNSSNLHPKQQRMISTREGARLQSFKDDFVFYGSKSSQYKQIGNAVPPLLARAVAETVKPFIENNTIIDLFSGAGGMSEGFLMENFKLLAANEIEKHYFETYKQNHSKYTKEENLILGNVTESEIKERIINSVKNKIQVGIVMGGPPCQGFSHAGWRDPNDTRNQLFNDFVEIVNSIKPEAFIMENVPGILTMRKGEAVKEIIESFEKIGYSVNKPFKLSAEEFGVPQKRKRVFIVGTLRKINIDAPKPLFSAKADDLPNPITVQDAIYGLPPLETDSGEFELQCNYKSTSPYEAMLMGEIDFKTFYTKCLQGLPVLVGNIS